MADMPKISPNSASVVAQEGVSQSESPTAACNKALHAFRSGLSQALLYSETTPQYVKAADASFAALAPVVQAFNVMELSIYRRTVTINGCELEVPPAELEAIASIERVFYKVGLYAFRFTAGLTSAELAAFMQLLAWNKFETTATSRVNAVLRGNGIFNIAAIEPVAHARPATTLKATIPAASVKPFSGVTPAVEQKFPAHGSTAIMPSLSGAIDLKPTLEGRIEDMGFINVLRLAGGKDGILSLQGSQGEARVAIKARTVISASYANHSGIEALVEISEILSGPYGYLAGEHDISKQLDIKISDLELTLQRYKEGERPKSEIDYY
jgi:hypothetical protein